MLMLFLQGTTRITTTENIRKIANGLKTFSMVNAVEIDLWSPLQKRRIEIELPRATTTEAHAHHFRFQS